MKQQLIFFICPPNKQQEVCYQYWPTKVGEPMQFNKLIVTLQSVDKNLCFYTRKFEIKDIREDRVSK